MIFPVLTSYPSKHSIYIGIAWNILLASISLVTYLVSEHYDRGGYYIVWVSIILTHISITYKNANNALFFFRYILKAILGAGAAVAWSINSTVYAAPFGVAYQTHVTTTTVVFAITLAIIGSSSGWYLVFGRARLKSNHGFKVRTNDPATWVAWIAIALAYGIVFLYIYREGGFVSASKQYGFDRRDIGFKIGVLNQLVTVFIVIYVVNRALSNKLTILSLTVATLPFFLAILSGNRADFLMQIGILLFIGYRHIRANFDSKVSLVLIILGGISMFVVTLFITVWRKIGSFSRSIELFYDSAGIISERNEIEVLTLATGNQMLGGLYAVVANLKLLGHEHLYGETYIDYLLRTPPAFLGLPRPTDWEWELNVNGLLMQQGGIFEVTEAYWNFGLIGAFLVPMIISYLFGLLLISALRPKPSRNIWLIAFICFGLIAPRATWYQNFAYWRLGTLFLLIVPALLFCKDFYKTREWSIKPEH